ncbi:MAG: hydroxymethylpyrimidine/phosphomethylpyrimidine kinase [Paracoccaceae bacterium]|jgi:hydroxymethylpyrimidine/phosphomethylpyrimidine kinase
MPPPIALTIAGSDSSAGAGIQADLKTFTALGLYGLTAVTCVVSETPLLVSKVHPIPPVILQDQIKLLLSSYPVAAIKTGMLYSKAHIVAVCELLQDVKVPIVVDPVMVASTGDPLLVEDALDAIAERLLPLATVITPNIPEAALLLGRSIETAQEQEDAAKELSEKYKVACYLKGGHLELDNVHRDLLATGEDLEAFDAPHLDLPQSHGTGCTFAAALTAGLAEGLSIPDASRRAHQFTQRALRGSMQWTVPGSKQTINHLDQSQSGRP